MKQNNRLQEKIPFQRLDWLAWLLDNSIQVPGTRYKIGLDGIIGLVPGIGDAVGSLLSLYILTEGAKARLPRPVLFRMAWNIAVETVIGTIPVFGDLFDMAWKSNARNVKLLHEYSRSSEKTVSESRWMTALIMVLLVLALIGLGILGFVFLHWIWNQITG